MTRRLLLCSVLAACACGGESIDHVIDVGGQPPGQAAQTAAEAICGRVADCGELDMDCQGDAGSKTCSATMMPVSYALCVAREREDALEHLFCVPLSSSEVELTNACLTEWSQLGCPPQQDLDDYAQEYEDYQNHGGAQPLPPESLFPRACQDLGTYLDDHPDRCDSGERWALCGSRSGGGSFESCAWTFTCSDGKYSTRCTRTEGTTYDCTCILDSVEISSFTADAVCSAVENPDFPSHDQAATLDTGCGWSLSEPVDQ